MAQEALISKYELRKLTVQSSTQISARTTAIIFHLAGERDPGERPVVISLTARARVAGKLVSIVEIAKRDLKSKGISCYQYNALTSEMLDILRETKKKTKGSTEQGLEQAAEDESDDAFETMGAPTGATKQRSVPVLTIYLSRTPVKELKAQHGEQ